MDKTVNAGDNSCECAEIGKADYLSVDNGSLGIVLAKDLPRIVLVFSVAQRNLFLLGIESLYVDIDNVADLQDMRFQESSEM